MYSRIFEIACEPVPDDERMISDDVPEWFFHTVADYATDLTDEEREASIGWLTNLLTGFGLRDKDKLSIISDPSPYFRERYTHFQKAAQDLTNISFYEFAATNKAADVIYTLRDAYEERFGGFYICDEWEFMPLAKWLRAVKPGDVFYIGGVLGYYC